MSRYRPNEPTSPVPLELLALLMRSDEARVSEIVRQLPDAQRVALALFCFARSHMRLLGLRIARDCSGGGLVAAGGAMGHTLVEQIESGEEFDVDTSQYRRRKVTLAKFAA